jgi:hypothetical protein
VAVFRLARNKHDFESGNFMALLVLLYEENFLSLVSAVAEQEKASALMSAFDLMEG